MSDKLAPRTTDEAAAFLKEQHAHGILWNQMCLSLQRHARGLQAVYPSALSAALATPNSERVHKVADLRRGMVAYSDDPNDSNKFGHIYFIAGWDGPRSDPSNLYTWTNLVGGEVHLVPITYYRANWGDGFQFGATWLNGYDFSEFNKPPKLSRAANLGENYEHAIEDVRKALHWHKKHEHEKGNARLVTLLEHDLEVMERRSKRFDGR